MFRWLKNLPRPPVAQKIHLSTALELYLLLLIPNSVPILMIVVNLMLALNHGRLPR